MVDSPADSRIMRGPSAKWLRVAVTLGPALLLLIAGVVAILTASGKDPGATLYQFLNGALGSDNSRSDVVMRALPILLCSSGLLLTFTAGLWNIGIEGQMMLGALFATFIARSVPEDGNALLAVPAELLMGALGGALWAGLTALLKTKGRVNEIFGGVALNFIASNILLFLLNGAWKAGNNPQTAPFKAPALLPAMTANLSLSIPAILIAVVAFVAVFLLLRGTHWGLQLRAMGRSERSAFLLGVRTERNILLSMMACGALAGIAGAFQAISPVSRTLLFPEVSGGLGFLALLVVMLVNVQPLWVPFVTLFFAIVPVGMLAIATTVDGSLGRVFESALVLIVVLTNGIRSRWQQPGDSN